MTDLRSLCARMADELDYYRQLLMDDRRETHALAAEARAALAEEPKPEGPTDEELDTCADEFLDWNPEGIRAFARAVLARWGHQPAPPAAGEQRHPMPMLLSERLPGPEDCDAEGRCWWSGAQGHHWELCRGFRGAAHWLPAHALPLPAGEVEPNAE